VGRVERELLARDPTAALSLVESFLKSDAKFFDRADDSDGCIGDAVREACRLWPRAAAQCKPPASGWTDRLFQLAQADDYGARDELLRSANLLLDETALRGVVERFDEELVGGVNSAAGEGTLPRSVFRASGSLHHCTCCRRPCVTPACTTRRSSLQPAAQRDAAGFRPRLP